MDIEKKYDPKKIEEKIYNQWETNGFFHVEPDKNKKKYVIVIPPPNITGFLHMGHALNNTIQDILIRWKRMQGYNALWVPGTDHAGIATQNVVERKLLKEGIKRQDLGREKFIKEVWKWKEEYGTRIVNQLKKLGASCDWQRLRFTMDENLSMAVRYAFVKLYEKGLIYRGERIINWCPRCTTALADEEVEYQEISSYLYFIKYPLVEGGFIEVATTRPETMLGDTAVAVHPADERYKKLIGKKVKLPLVGREIPIIPDEKVEMEFGTGAVKVTPAHDPNDFEIGQRHKLPVVVVIDKEGKMNEMAGEFKGLDRFEAREKIIEELKKRNLLSKIEPHIHRVGHCYRCNTPVEPYISSQWFVKMEPLAQPAIKVAEEGKLKFYPERWKKVYLNWLYNIKDWCISRQIWWGHRIPIWYCENEQCPPIASVEEVKKCPNCGNENVKQDEDVLDTWFSSWLWPFSVFGWPEETQDLKVFYPTDTLVTAQEILFFWVARMVMAGMEFMNEIPFENVYIHGTVRDETGRKMSKSLGNAIDPVEIIENYGADSLRFSLISMTAFGQDVFLSPTFYIKGRNFMNKIWNAARYIITLNENQKVSGLKIYQNFDYEKLLLPEKWIVLKLNETIGKVTELLEKFHFNESINILYEFFWHNFCDWYIEMTKIYDRNSDYFKNTVLQILNNVLITSLKLLHPFVPFITEQLWQIFKKYISDLETEYIIISNWPEEEKMEDVETVEKMEQLTEIITTIRNIKSKIKIPAGEKVDIYIEGNFAPFEKEIIGFLGKADFKKEKEILKSKYLAKNFPYGRLFISIEGIINIQNEIEKLEKEKEFLQSLLDKTEKMLKNKNFLEKAKKEVVEKTMKNRDELIEKIENIKKDIEFFRENLMKGV